jgi:hypothetical protein
MTPRSGSGRSPANGARVDRGIWRQRPKQRIIGPAATATYCLPPTKKVIGGAFIRTFVGKRQRGLRPADPPPRSRRAAGRRKSGLPPVSLSREPGQHPFAKLIISLQAKEAQGFAAQAAGDSDTALARLKEAVALED